MFLGYWHRTKETNFKRQTAENGTLLHLALLGTGHARVVITDTQRKMEFTAENGQPKPSTTTIAREGTLLMQQEVRCARILSPLMMCRDCSLLQAFPLGGTLSLIGLGETNLFGTSWDKFWFRLSNKALVYVNSDSGEGDTIQLESIVAVIPEDVDDVSCLLLKVASNDGSEKCHRLRALPDEHGHDTDLLQEWKMSILMSVESCRQENETRRQETVPTESVGAHPEDHSDVPPPSPSVVRTQRQGQEEVRRVVAVL